MPLIPEGSAARSPGTRRAMAAIAALVLAADQVSKSLVLAAHPAGAVGTGWVSVRLVRNTGASGGIASGYPVLVTLTALAITGLAAVLALRASSRVVAWALAAVLGGAAGNLADRLVRAPGFGRGGVVDWIHFGGGGGSLDVADIAIQLGVVIAIVAMLAGDLGAKRRHLPRPARFRDKETGTGRLPPRPPPHHRQGRRRAQHRPTAACRRARADRAGR